MDDRDAAGGEDFELRIPVGEISGYSVPVLEGWDVSATYKPIPCEGTARVRYEWCMLKVRDPESGNMFWIKIPPRMAAMFVVDLADLAESELPPLEQRTPGGTLVSKPLVLQVSKDSTAIGRLVRYPPDLAPEFRTGGTPDRDANPWKIAGAKDWRFMEPEDHPTSA